MEPNPYQSPQEQGYEPPTTPDAEKFSTTRLFLIVFVLMVLALFGMSMVP
jgi:hypothetical protein